MTNKDSTGGAGQPASSPADKHFRVEVPEHDVDPGSTGHTFLQMGTFPVAGDRAAPRGAEGSLALARGAGAVGRSALGGQWSHTDGNRVTTTAGNVVEVIKGSHVAYRSSAHSPPGPTLSCTWAESYYYQVGSEDVPIGESTPTGTNGQSQGYSDAKASAPTDTAGAFNVKFQAAFASAPTT